MLDDIWKQLDAMEVPPGKALELCVDAYEWEKSPVTIAGYSHLPKVEQLIAAAKHKGYKAAFCEQHHRGIHLHGVISIIKHGERNFEPSAPPDDNPSGIVECTSCGKQTALLEAECRRFNPGRCGKCGGPLFPIERKWVRERNFEP